MLVMERGEEPQVSRGGALPSALCHSYAALLGPSWRWAVGRDVPARAQARWLRRQGKGSRSLCTALPGTSAARQRQCDVAGETQVEDRAVSHSHNETGHGFPCPRKGGSDAAGCSTAGPGSCPATEHSGQITSLLSTSVPCL